MGVMTAPVPASGSCPAWMARVAKPPWCWSPCCCSLMTARLTAHRGATPTPPDRRRGGCRALSALVAEDLHRVTDPYGARLQDAQHRPSPGVQGTHRTRPDMVVHEAAGSREPDDLEERVPDPHAGAGPRRHG